MSTSTALYVGWLLRVNRLGAADKTLRSGAGFARAFRARGQPHLAPSQVTRWENGTLAPSTATIRRYESLLALPAGTLVTLKDALMRSGSRPADTGRPAASTRLEELLDLVLSEHDVSGAVWMELGELVAATPGLVLYPRDRWRDVAERLLSELVLAAGPEWLKRREAMCRLLEHPHAGRESAAACIRMADDPSSTAVIEPLSLLNVVADHDSNRYVLQQISEGRDGRRLSGALQASLDKIRLRHFDDHQRFQLADDIAQHLIDQGTDETLQPIAAEAARLLLRQLPEHSALRRALRRSSSATTRGRAKPQHSENAPLSQAIANGITGLPPELTKAAGPLHHLIRVAFTDTDPDRRLFAGMLLSATPYRMPLATAALNTFRGGRDLPTGFLSTLTHLRVDIHRPLIHTILTQPGWSTSQRHEAAWAAPHCSGLTDSTTWRRIFRRQAERWGQDRSPAEEEILRGIVYGIGTDQHLGLLTAIRGDHLLPLTVRHTAAWLLRA